jgi:hypothetical protein
MTNPQTDLRLDYGNTTRTDGALTGHTITGYIDDGLRDERAQAAMAPMPPMPYHNHPIETPRMAETLGLSSETPRGDRGSQPR